MYKYNIYTLSAQTSEEGNFHALKCYIEITEEGLHLQKTEIDFALTLQTEVDQSKMNSISTV